MLINSDFNSVETFISHNLMPVLYVVFHTRPMQFKQYTMASAMRLLSIVLIVSDATYKQALFFNYFNTKCF